MPIEDTKKRLPWLDISKGITIILMVAGHSAMPNELLRFVFAFHMPLFFITSGITTKYSSFPNFLIKKTKGLLFPFIIYSVVVLILKAVLSNISINDVFVNWLKMGWLGIALWFVPVLYLSLVVSWCINMISNKWGYVIFTLSLLIIGEVLNYYSIWLPWNMATVPYATFFIIAGYWFKPYCSVIDCRHFKWYIYVVLFMVTFVISHFWRLDMAWNKCSPIIPLTIGALSGTALIFLVSKFIEAKSTLLTKVLSAIGRETFAIMAFSQIIIGCLNNYITIPFYVKYILLFCIFVIIISLKNVGLRMLKPNANNI